jgi:hypothetical protein
MSPESRLQTVAFIRTVISPKKTIEHRRDALRVAAERARSLRQLERLRTLSARHLSLVVPRRMQDRPWPYALQIATTVSLLGKMRLPGRQN